LIIASTGNPQPGFDAGSQQRLFITTGGLDRDPQPATLPELFYRPLHTSARIPETVHGQFAVYGDIGKIFSHVHAHCNHGQTPIRWKA
jgi:hypothetical protein